MKNGKKGSVTNRLFEIAREGRGRLVLSCIFSTAGMLASLVPYLSVYFIARQLLMTYSHNTGGTVYFWIVIAGGGIAGNMLFSFLGSYGAHKVAFHILYNFRIRVMEHLGRLPLGFFSENTTGSIQKTMDENIEKLEGFIAHMLPDAIGSGAVLAVLFISLFALNGWLALAVIASIMLSVILQFLMFGGKKGKILWSEIAASSKETTSAFSEFVKGISEVKLFGLTGIVTKSLHESVNKYKTWELRQYKRAAPPYTAYKTVVLSILSVVLPAGVLMLSFNPSDKGLMLSLLMALILTPAIYDPLMTSISYGAQMGQISVGLDSIDKIMDTPAIMASSSPSMPKAYDVEFRNVSFSYRPSSDSFRLMALSNLSFRAEQGSMTALVGPSGGGKSTVGALIARFWDAESGQILIGGTDIRDIGPEYLMDLISIVFQDTYIFADTICGNLTMNRNYSREQVEAAAKAAQCHEFILQLPNGYNTRIGSGGSGLSGGECQRIAIARAILKDSPVVVLDEALAYSDAENENLIQKAIGKLIENKTVIVIAHRLQSIRGASQILLLNRGELKEAGSHDTLMSLESEYRELWELQHEADKWAIDFEEVFI